MTTFAVAFDLVGTPARHHKEGRCCIVCSGRLSKYNAGVACQRHPAEKVETAMRAAGMPVRKIPHVVKNVRPPAHASRR